MNTEWGGVILNKSQIVIVEDDPTMATFLCHVLSDEYDTYVINNGHSAINVIEIKKPDLILLDLILPDVHGFDILRAIKNNNDEGVRDIPVIITTGDEQDNSVEEGLKLGAIDYILKPYKKTLIKLQIRNHIELLNYRRNLHNIIEQQTTKLYNIHNTLIGVISLLVGERDGSTGNHISQTVKYMESLVKHLDDESRKLMPEEDVELVILLSSLHDVGKITTADSILSKPSALTAEEFEIMKQHTIKGGKLLRRAKTMLEHTGLENKVDYAIEMAESHHEKYDGSGYPYGLEGDAIPFVARVLHICDVYDALTSERPYKSAYTHNQAFEIIINGDGRTKPTHFDPRVLNAFIRAEREFAHICASNT